MIITANFIRRPSCRHLHLQKEAGIQSAPPPPSSRSSTSANHRRPMKMLHCHLQLKRLSLPQKPLRRSRVSNLTCLFRVPVGYFLPPGSPIRQRAADRLFYSWRDLIIWRKDWIAGRALVSRVAADTFIARKIDSVKSLHLHCLFFEILLRVLRLNHVLMYVRRVKQRKNVDVVCSHGCSQYLCHVCVRNMYLCVHANA